MENLGSIPSMKVVLLGPSGTGKTTFLLTLLEENPPENTSPTTKTYIKETIRQYFKFSGGRYIPSEQYKLIIADTPGMLEKRDERRKGLEKSIVGIFFYDLTDPKTVKELELILKNEVIETEEYYNLMGIVLIGCKKDQGMNMDAVEKALNIAGELTNLTIDLWGYKVPHLAINCKNREEVGKSFYIAESLVMDKPPQLIIDSLSIENVGVVKAEPTPPVSPIPKQPVTYEEARVEDKKTAEISAEEMEEKYAEPVEKPLEEKPISKPIPPHLREEERAPTTPAVTTEVGEIVEKPEILEEELRVEISGLEISYRIRPIDSDKIWSTIEKLHKSRSDEIEEVYFVKKAGEILLMAYSPREKEVNKSDLESLVKALQFESIADALAMDQNVGVPKYYIISSSDKSLLLVKRRNALLILKVKGKPSEELINILV